MNTEQEILNIKKDLRASMNGILSARMREAGLPYKLIFGVELPRLQTIASEYTPNRQLAQTLWNENIRETRLLACLLMPAEEFTHDLADIWGEEIPTAEVAQIMATHLMPKTRMACSISFEWIASDNIMKQICGFLCVARLLQQSAQIEMRSLTELENQAQALTGNASPSLRRAINVALAWKEEYEKCMKNQEEKDSNPK
ncbi:MAG: DNA alkylation repair protein [Bacteroidaceae bacterium]